MCRYIYMLSKLELRGLNRTCSEGRCWFASQKSEMAMLDRSTKHYFSSTFPLNFGLCFLVSFDSIHEPILGSYKRCIVIVVPKI